MTNDEFIRYVRSHIRKYLPPELEEATMQISKIVRPNDEVYTGLTLIKPDKVTGPQIPLEEYAQRVRDGSDLDDVMTSVAEELTIYKESSNLLPIGNNAFDLFDFDDVRPFLTTKLCDQKDSAKYLSDKPWTPVGDSWRLLYRVMMSQQDNKESVQSMPVTNDIMAQWGIDLETLHHAAVENESTQIPAILVRPSAVRTVMKTRSDGEYNLLSNKPITNIRSTDMFVLSKADLFNGACVVGWEGVFERVADTIGRDFYIVLTSIHEVMIAPAFASLHLEDVEYHLQSNNANSNVVSPENILSNRLQYYNKRRHTLGTPERRYR